MTRLEDEYDEIYRTLGRVELQKGAGELDDLQLDDLFKPGSELWLGYYTQQGVETALERYGFFDDLATAGFHDVRLELKNDDPDEHLLRIWSEKPELDEPLVELVVQRGALRPSDVLADRLEDSAIPVLSVEWLQLQNPEGVFTSARAPLPGQHLPGLGVGEQVLELLRQTVKRLDLDGLATIPAHFHNAFFYSEDFEYFDPETEGLFLALCRDVLPQTGASVGAASWAIAWSMVLDDAQEEPFEWFHDAMVAPVSDRLRAYFDADDYNREVQAALSSHEFTVFQEPLWRSLRAKGIHPLDQGRIDEWIEEGATVPQISSSKSDEDGG